MKKPKRKPYIPPPDFRNVERGKALLERLIKDSEQKDSQRLVTVCAECLQASCWQGIFMCEESRNADIVEKTVAELTELGLENPIYWQPKP